MSNIRKTIKNGLAVGGVRKTIRRNADGVYSGKQTPYFAMPQNRIASLYGKYATNYYAGEMQGWDADDFYAWWPVKLRCMDVTRETTGSNLSDDIKAMVVCEPEGVNYVPLGAHVRFASNTWLVTNPSNIAAILSDTIIRRCNAVYKRLDYYGNVLTCPFNIPKVQPRGAQDDYTKNMILADHYFTCAMQLNEVSAVITENTRMILGDAAYSVRGLDNFTQEFTGDEDSTHILYFQLQREEKTEVYDDMDRKIADGLAFSWDINLAANVSMRTGETQTIVPSSIRNGQSVTSTAENPISYAWESSDTSVLQIDAEGEITAVGEGDATITCRLAQNPEIAETVTILVESAAGAYVAFSGAMPAAIAEQESAVISAAYYENGAATEQPVTFTLSGPPETAYSYEIDGNTITIYCWERSEVPLVVTATREGSSGFTINGMEIGSTDVIAINDKIVSAEDGLSINGKEIALSAEASASVEIALEAW